MAEEASAAHGQVTAGEEERMGEEQQQEGHQREGSGTQEGEAQRGAAAGSAHTTTADEGREADSDGEGESEATQHPHRHNSNSSSSSSSAAMRQHSGELHAQGQEREGASEAEANSDADSIGSFGDERDDRSEGEEGDEDDWLDPFPNVNVEELEQRVVDQRAANETLWLETQCLQRYYERQQADIIDTDDEAAPDTVQVKERTGRRRSRSMRSSARSNVSSIPTTLTDVQKSDIAQRDLDYLRAQLQQFKEESLQKVHTLQAAIAEAEVRLMEIPKLEALFDDEVTRSADTSRSGKVETEALHTFYRRRMKQCDTLVDKLRVKNQTMRGQKQRAQSQLKAKDEIGGHLHQVDFEQLKIENEQFSIDIDKRNKELSKLKSSAGRTNQTLEKYKERLRVLQAESERVAAEISQREDLIQRVSKERRKVGSAHSRLKSRSSKLSQELEEHRMPDVLDLVKTQATMPKLQHTVNTMERKLDLAQRDFEQTRRSLRSTRRTTTTIPK